jgi:hypothetical protein
MVGRRVLMLAVLALLTVPWSSAQAGGYHGRGYYYPGPYRGYYHRYYGPYYGGFISFGLYLGPPPVVVAPAPVVVTPAPGLVPVPTPVPSPSGQLPPPTPQPPARPAVLPYPNG